MTSITSDKSTPNEPKHSWTCAICHDPLNMEHASGPLKSYDWFKHYDIDRMRDGYYGRKIHVCMKQECVPKCTVCHGNLSLYVRFKANNEWSCYACARKEADVTFDPADDPIDSDCEYAVRNKLDKDEDEDEDMDSVHTDISVDETSGRKIGDDSSANIAAATNLANPGNTVTYSFDEFNNLTMIVSYHRMVFNYTFSESYLTDKESWELLIKQIDEKDELILDNGDTQSWQPTLSMQFPNKIKKLYIEALKTAINDPRIDQIVDR
jgi:hypothetical protein